MATINDLERFREDLLAARFSGVRRFRDQNGEEVEYRSDSELKNAIAAVNSEIAAATRKPSSTVRFHTSKGL